MWLIPSVNVDASADQGLICKFCISGWWAIASTVVAFILFTDCLIYWIHRFLHHKYVYKYIHKGHHTWKVRQVYSQGPPHVEGKQNLIVLRPVYTKHQRQHRDKSAVPLVILLLLPSATKLGQGNIFRRVCQEFCSHPGAVHAGKYGQQAGGTHPTGMHTC